MRNCNSEFCPVMNRRRLLEWEMGMGWLLKNFNEFDENTFWWNWVLDSLKMSVQDTGNVVFQWLCLESTMILFFIMIFILLYDYYVINFCYWLLFRFTVFFVWWFFEKVYNSLKIYFSIIFYTNARFDSK